MHTLRSCGSGRGRADGGSERTHARTERQVVGRIDLPPPDADAARREIVGNFAALFGESTTEQRQQLLTTPSELPAKLQSLVGGPCAGTLPVVTHLSFLDDDRAEVRFRFEGPTLPEGARSFSFDGVAIRVDGRWLIDPAAPLHALGLGASVCGP